MELSGAAERPLRVCVVGCGAVGSLFAANLGTLDDVEVWAYDLDAEHVEAINRDGLRLTGAGDVVGTGQRHHRRRRAAPVRVRDRRDQGDAHRGGDRRDAPTRSRTAPSRRVQNGIGNEEVLARHVERVIRGTTFPAGKLLAPGRRPVGRQGRHDARPVRAEARRRRRRSPSSPRRAPRGGMPTNAVADARGPQWRKVIFNAATNPLGALTGLTHGALCELAAARRLASAARRRGQGGRGRAGDRARLRPRGADRPRRRGRLRPQRDAAGRARRAGDRGRLPERRHRRLRRRHGVPTPAQRGDQRARQGPRIFLAPA